MMGPTTAAAEASCPSGCLEAADRRCDGRGRHARDMLLGSTLFLFCCDEASAHQARDDLVKLVVAGDT